MGVVARFKKSELLLNGEIQERSPSVKNGLVQWFPFDKTLKGTRNGNILDYENQWVLNRSGSQGDFAINGNPAVDINTVIMYPGPFGYEEPVWAALSNDAASDNDGGWTVSSKTINKNKKYRLSVWVRRENAGNGTLYFGCQGSTVSGLGTTTVDTNPYFTVIDSTYAAVKNNWVLLVAHIQPYNYSGTTNDVDSGIYNTSGTKLNGATDYKWLSNSTIGGHRAYLFYSTSTTERVYWCRPRMEICDGSESKLEDLILGMDNNSNVSSPSYTSLVSDGSGIAVEEATENILSYYGFDPSLEYSGTAYPFVYTGITGRVQQLTPTGGTYTMQFEGKCDPNGGGYPVMYIYFTDWTWAYNLPITSRTWERKTTTFSMPNPTGKTVMMAVYHVSGELGGKSYARNLQLENKGFATDFTKTSRAGVGYLGMSVNPGPNFTIGFKFKPDVSWARTFTTGFGRRILDIVDDVTGKSIWLEDYNSGGTKTNSDPWIGFDQFITNATPGWHWHYNGVDWNAGKEYWFFLTKNGSIWTKYFTDSIISGSSGMFSQTIGIADAGVTAFSPKYIGFSGSFCAVYSNVMVYNRALSDDEVKKIMNQTVSIDSKGNMYDKVSESINLPSDSIYFPLDYSAQDRTGAIKPSEETNVIYDENAAWVGSGTTNILPNHDAANVNETYKIPGSYKPGWDTNLHSDAILINGWDTGYNGGVPSPSIGYHAKWVYEGIGKKPCIKFIDQNGQFGQGHRWLGMTINLGQPALLGWTVGTTITVSWMQKGDRAGMYVNPGIYHFVTSAGTYGFDGCMGEGYIQSPFVWERKSFTYTITSNWNLYSDATLYIYGYNNSTEGISWVDNFQIEVHPFKTPFIQGTGNNLISDLMSTWTAKEYVTVTTGEIDPVGGTTAVKAVPTATDNYFGIRKNIGTGNFIVSLWLKGSVAGKVATVNVGDRTSGNKSFAKQVTLTTSWQYVEFSGTILESSSNALHIGGWSTWTDNSYSVYVAFPKVAKNIGKNYEMSSLEYNLNRDYGLNWSSDFSIVYWKKPVATIGDNKTGFNLESLGCNNNTVGNWYSWWGKTVTTNNIAIGGYNVATLDPAVYFDNWQMVSIVRNGATMTIKIYLSNGTIASGPITPPSTANACVTQYGYDFKLGGYDNGNAPNTYYRDLIIAKRAFTDTELTNLFKNKFNFTNNNVKVNGILKEKIIL